MNSATEKYGEKCTPSCTQLVLYKPCAILQPFRESSRRFNLCGKQWVIHQDWSGLGVAGVVWEAAIHLVEFMEARWQEGQLRDKKVVELGTGTGMVGMAAAALGAASVKMTDKHTKMAERNLEANLANLTPSAVSVIQYEWGNPLPSSLLPPFDVLLGADIVYIKDSFPALAWSMKALSKQSTDILLSCRHRYNEVETFFTVLRENGFDCTELERRNNVSVYRINLL